MIRWLRARFRGITTSWLTWRASGAAVRSADSPLREFVYLDEVSVYSLLASRVGAVADSITENQASSLSLEGSGGGTLGDGTSEASAGVKFGYSRSNSRQILRKATVQSTFRHLARTERRRTLGVQSGRRVPRVTNAAELAGVMRAGHAEHVIPLDELRRGRLIELQVRLDSERLYEILAIVSTVSDAFNQASSLIKQPQSFRELEEGALLLRSLLGGLVPIVGYVTDYVLLTHAADTVLARRDFVRTLPAEIAVELRDVKVVAVGEEDSFWLDLRRVLFSNLDYTVLARVGRSGVQDSWNPVKLMDLLGRIDPVLPGQLLKTLAIEPASEASVVDQEATRAVMLAFALAAVDAHGWEVAAEDIAESVRAEAPLARLDDYDEAREAFDRILEALRARAQGMPSMIDRARIPALRRDALGTLRPSGPVTSGEASLWAGPLIDSEIVAIYW